MSDSIVITQTEQIYENEIIEEAQAEENVRLAQQVVFKDCKRGIGIKICGGCSIDGEELHGVFIKRVLPGGQADTQGDLRRGDQILEVNGENLEGVTTDRAASILRLNCFTNQVELVICRDEQARLEFNEIMQKSGLPVNPPPQEVAEGVGHDDLQGDQDKLPTAEREEDYMVTPPTQMAGHALLNGDVLSHKFPWRGLIPSHSSTPNPKGVKGSMMTPAMVGGSGSPAEFSPVLGPVLSLANALSHGPLFTNQSGHHGNTTLTRKPSVGPHEKFEVERLTSTLNLLGFDVTPEKEVAMRSRLTIDQHGCVFFGEAVDVVSEVFREEIEKRSLNLSGFLLPDNTSRLGHPPLYQSRVEMNGGASGSVVSPAEVDVESLRQENLRLQLMLEEKEEEIEIIKKDQREMRTKVQLAAKAQKVARDMEHDYEEVVRLLEGEIAQLKLQRDRQVDADPINQRRLAVLTCQLRKAESEKRTLKVATEKLLQFAENVQATGSNSKPPPRPLAIVKSGGILGKHKQSPAADVASEARDVIKAVRSLIDGEPLPFGWEECYTEDGVKYYINHLNQVTTWTHPLSGVSHVPPSEGKSPTQDQSKPT
ncbi:syntaxin-binding protein 4-like [Dreissena polymorpha]|uniref:syntaxin-binding protein 4-like n=1 Tax=Dreissena polymorpha TaxID=45954 RepID=UPI002263E329|nr:syntaxin-binding protein 4-like [Dreissena polymorpha]